MEEYLNSLLQVTKLEINSGINIELKECLNESEEIVLYKIDVKDNKYFIDIKLKNPSISNIRTEYNSLIDFIRYDYCTFSLKVSGDDFIQYKIISLRNAKNEGFYFELTFH